MKRDYQNFKIEIPDFKKKIKVSILINLSIFLLVIFVIIFLRQYSLAGVLMFIATVITALFFNSRIGIVIGLINLTLIGGIIVVHFYFLPRPIPWAHILTTLPLFILSGYLAGKYNETKIKYALGLEKEIRKRTRELEEAKNVLEIKVEDRTKELRELTEGLDKQVKERTKEIQERINELEKFRKLTINRELKMIEFKKEIKKLKEELEKYKK